MLSIESMPCVESVRPLDSLWSCAVVDVANGENLKTDYILEVFSISGFENVRFLLDNEVVNVPLKKR